MNMEIPWWRDEVYEYDLKAIVQEVLDEKKRRGDEKNISDRVKGCVVALKK